MPGSASRCDYQSLASEEGRLFISHMGAGRLVVVDVRGASVLGDLDAFPVVAGLLPYNGFVAVRPVKEGDVR